MNFNFNLLNFSILIIVLYFLYKINKNVEYFSLRLAHPNKIFANEHAVKEKDMHLAFPSKCLSCGHELMSMGVDPMWGGRTKCFACENAVSGGNPLRSIGRTAI